MSCETIQVAPRSSRQRTAWREWAASLRSSCVAITATVSLGPGCGGSSQTTQHTQPAADTHRHGEQLETPYERAPSPYFDSIRPADDMVLAQIDTVDAIEANAATLVGEQLVLRLHVDGCAITEAEPRRAERPADMPCREFNLDTFDGRRQRMLVVPAGPALILVYNEGDAEDAGLWLRRRNSPEDTAASIGGVAPDDVGEARIVLEPGVWLYSSPVSPTPDYLLRVE